MMRDKVLVKDQELEVKEAVTGFLRHMASESDTPASMVEPLLQAAKLLENSQEPSAKHSGEAVRSFIGSGVISSAQPPIELIPMCAIRDLGARFGRGVRLKGMNGAWNAIHNVQAADNQEFVIDRLAHGIMHGYKAISRLTGELPPLDSQEVADGGDAGAVMFSGALLSTHLYRKWMREPKKNPTN